MELKFTDLNSEIVLAKDLNLVKLFSLNSEINLRNESYKLFFQEYALIAQMLIVTLEKKAALRRATSQ